MSYNPDPPNHQYQCDRCLKIFDSMDALAEHARVVHGGAPPREERERRNGAPTRGEAGGVLSDMTRGQSSGRTTGGEALHPGTDGFHPPRTDDEEDEEERPSTKGTSAGGTTKPGAS